MEKAKVVIDTNLLISAALVSQSPPHKLLQAWHRDLFFLVTSYEQLQEIREVSKRKKLKAYPLFTKKIAELIENIAFAAEIGEPVVHLPVHVRDLKDDFLLATALGADADYLLTGDEDLLILNKNLYIGKLKILSVREFLSLINFQ